MSTEDKHSCTAYLKKKIDFSIEGILREPYLSSFTRNSVDESERFETQEENGDSDRELNTEGVSDNLEDVKKFSWLYCSRFKPPKLPRSKKRSTRKRYGRGPRIPFAAHQIAVLESAFSKSHYLSPDCIARLAESLILNETRVKIWFQNRRARFRREQELLSLSSTQRKSEEICGGHESPDDAVNYRGKLRDALHGESRAEPINPMNRTVHDGDPTSDRQVGKPDDPQMHSSIEFMIPSAKYPPPHSVASNTFETPLMSTSPGGGLNTAYSNSNRILFGGYYSAFVPLFRR